jgi:hypothetical protein
VQEDERALCEKELRNFLDVSTVGGVEKGLLCLQLQQFWQPERSEK